MDKCKSIEEYCDIIMTTAHKLNAMKFVVTDEWVGTLLLAGLPDEYKPMIMGMESSGVILNEDTALCSKSANNYKNKENKGNLKNNIRCFGCNKIGHTQKTCRQMQRYNSKDNFKNSSNKVGLTFLTSKNIGGNEWYLDSGASTHLTNNKNNYINSYENVKITTANNSNLNVESVGDVAIKSKWISNKVTVKNVMYSPDAAVNYCQLVK